MLLSMVILFEKTNKNHMELVCFGDMDGWFSMIDVSK